MVYGYTDKYIKYCWLRFGGSGALWKINFEETLSVIPENKGELMRDVASRLQRVLSCLTLISLSVVNIPRDLSMRGRDAAKVS